MNGTYQTLEPIPGPVNTEGDEHMPFIAPDDSYIIFAGRNRPDGVQGFNLYISFRGEDGIFQEPTILNDEINSSSGQICPVVTPDGRFLFYLQGTNVRWMSTDFIEEMRPGGK